MGGPLDYTVSYLGQVIVIVISRPRSLTILLNLESSGALYQTVVRMIIEVTEAVKEGFDKSCEEAAL